MLSWDISWSGLTGPATAAHFHGPAAAGIAAGVQVNWGALSGLTSPSIGSTALSDEQETEVLADLWYINIHTALNGPGEIRGQVLVTGLLPVELAGFDVRLEEDDASLSWQTLSETDNAGFEVQHTSGQASAHAIEDSWRTIGFVEGSGTSDEERSYTFTVSDLAPGYHAFRLKQIDLDGAFAYSPTVEAVAEVPGKMALYPAYPNPFNPSTRLQFAVSTEQPVLVSLYNSVGRLVDVLYRGTPGPGALQNIVVNGDALPSGIYLVRLEAGAEISGQTIILSK